MYQWGYFNHFRRVWLLKGFETFCLKSEDILCIFWGKHFAHLKIAFSFRYNLENTISTNAHRTSYTPMCNN